MYGLAGEEDIYIVNKRITTSMCVSIICESSRAPEIMVEGRMWQIARTHREFEDTSMKGWNVSCGSLYGAEGASTRTTEEKALLSIKRKRGLQSQLFVLVGAQ